MSALSFAIRGHSQLFRRDVENGADFRLENATIQDFLEDVAEYHRVECGCLVNIGSQVWMTPVSLDEAAMRDEPPPAQDALSLQTRLDSLRGPHLSLLIDGVAQEFGTNEFLRLAREKRFIPVSHGTGTVFRRSGCKATLPSENFPSYNSLCATPGSVFVDKSAFFRSLLDKFISSRVNIIRRPRGFGKTTFLSMVDAYFDPQSPSAHFPFVFEPELVSRSLFAAHGQMLVFSMDFAKLSLHTDLHEDDHMDVNVDESDNVDEIIFDEYDSEDECMSEDEYPGWDTCMTDEELDAKCHSFLDDAARNFYNRYQCLLHEREEAENREGVEVTFTDIVRWSRQEEYSLVFLIDNYTAPLLCSPDPRFRRAITANIFGRLANLAKVGVVSYGLLVGEDIPDGNGWIGMPSIWKDLSSSSDLAEAIGFTRSEVVAFGQALSIDLLSALQSSLPVDKRDNERLLYAAADVLTIARGLIKGDLPVATTLSVRTLAIPPPVEEVPLKTLVRRRIEVLFGPGTWPDPIDEDIDVHTGFPDDDESSESPSNANDPYEAANSSWEGRRPALTLDNSSESSSSRSSSGSSAGSASGVTTKPLIILGGLESPLLGYPRKELEP